MTTRHLERADLEELARLLEVSMSELMLFFVKEDGLRLLRVKGLRDFLSFLNAKLGLRLSATRMRKIQLINQIFQIVSDRNYQSPEVQLLIQQSIAVSPHPSLSHVHPAAAAPVNSSMYASSEAWRAAVSSAANRRADPVATAQRALTMPTAPGSVGDAAPPLRVQFGPANFVLNTGLSEGMRQYFVQHGLPTLSAEYVLAAVEMRNPTEKVLTFTCQLPVDFSVPNGRYCVLARLLQYPSQAGEPVTEIPWSYAYYLKINGALVDVSKNNKKVRVRQYNDAYITLTPADLTCYMRRGVNRVHISHISQFSGVLVLYTALEVPIETLADRLPRREPLFERPGKDAAEDEVTEVSYNVQLRCPLSYSRIKRPIKGLRCRHVQCFDAAPYLTFSVQNQIWNCPHCLLPAPYHELFVDGFFEQLLARSADDEDICGYTLDAEGTIIETDDGGAKRYLHNPLVKRAEKKAAAVTLSLLDEEGLRIEADADEDAAPSLPSSLPVTLSNPSTDAALSNDAHSLRQTHQTALKTLPAYPSPSPSASFSSRPLSASSNGLHMPSEVSSQASRSPRPITIDLISDSED